MKAIQRLLGLALALVVILGALAATSGSAQAVTAHPVGARSIQTSAQATPVAEATGNGTPHGLHHQAVGKISTDGCGFLQLCIYFGQSEQSWIGGISTVTLAAAICLYSVGAACAAAQPIAWAVTKYIDAHGLCPSSRPRLEVHVLPIPAQGIKCVGY